jgi:transcriptional regulator with XRE-family HTH domain
MASQAATLSEFLRSRRAELDPGRLGFPLQNRRVPGLRREELAQLAGISSEYYVRIEQGRGHRMSMQVVSSLARALDLDEQQRVYFYRIALSNPATEPHSPTPRPVSEPVLSLLRSNAAEPIYVFDSNQDIVAINEMADLLLPQLADCGDNLVLATFGVSETSHQSEDWRRIARNTVAALRFHGDPHHPRFQQIIGELSIGDVHFRRMWADHDASPLSEGSASIPIEGKGPVLFSNITLETADGLFLTAWPTAPGTPAHDALELLRSSRLTGRGVRGPLEGHPARSVR